MRRNRQTYKAASIVSSIFMILTLVWLTVSTPFVNAAQQQKQTSSASIPADEETPGSDDNNPFSNTTEEKAESGSGTLSEYLHNTHELVHPTGLAHKHNASHDANVYVAFHGEMLCPPPNFILS